MNPSNKFEDEERWVRLPGRAEVWISTARVENFIGPLVALAFNNRDAT
jgi:hypothetical protein